MSDPLPGGIDPDVLVRYLVGGALAGTAAGGATLLARELSRKKRERDAAKDIEASTLRFTLPAKRGEADATITTDREGDETGSFSKLISVCGDKARAMDGRFDTDKRANWQTMSAAAVAAGLGGLGSYKLINKMYDNHQVSKAREELDEARNEYLNLLNFEPETGKVDIESKPQELIDHQAATAAPTGDDEEGAAVLAERKTAEEDFNNFSTMHAPLALAALLTLVGAGSTAYGVKHMLDEANPVDTEVGPQGVTRVVFDDPDTADYAKSASHDEIMAATAVMMDIVSGQPRTTSDPAVQWELKRAGLTTADLYKAAMPVVTPALLNSPEYKDTENLIELLKKNKDVRRGLQRVGMNARPVLKHFKWMLDMPLADSYADKKLYERIAQEGLNSNSYGIKYSSAALIASAMASKNGRKLKDMQAAKDLDKSKARDSHDDVFAKRVRVEASDDVAQEFLNEHLDEILTTLRDVSNRRAAY